MTITAGSLANAPPVVPATSQGGSEGTLEEIVALAAESLTLLIAQYQLSPRVQNWICSYLNRLQELETAVVDVSKDVLSLDTAAGVHLDLLGQIVREARNGRTDDEYRRSLRVRVLINISDGKAEQLIAISRLFEDMDSVVGSYVDVQDLQPARMEIRIHTTPLNPPIEIDKRLQQAKAGGVSLQTLLHYGFPGNSFTFIRAADYPEKDTLQGFEGIAGPVGGGKLAHVPDSVSPSFALLESGDAILLEAGGHVVLETG